MSKEKKILATSVVAWNDLVGGDSLSTLLKNFSPENIANIYIRPELPNSPVCRNYLQITENDIIKSIWNRKHKTAHFYNGTENPTKQSEDTIQTEKNRYRRFKNFRWYIFLMIRELVWILGKWKTEALNRFVDDFAPDVVLYSVDGYMHMNRITRYVLHRTKAKGVAIVWDDNFSYKTDPKTPGYLLHRFLLRRSFKKTLLMADTVFSFTPKCAKELYESFGVSSVLLTKPMQSIARPQNEMHQPIRMVYTGNLIYGREKTLLAMAKAFSALNQNELLMTLDVYTNSEISKKNLKYLQEARGVSIHGAIPQKEAFEKQANADVLLFLEAISGSKKHVARLSFSTKLTDYFSMGKCIFAVGPSDIAPIEYMFEHKLAEIVTNKKDIFSSLKKLTNNPERIQELGDHVYRFACENHSEEIIREKFSQSINNT